MAQQLLYYLKLNANAETISNRNDVFKRHRRAPTYGLNVASGLRLSVSSPSHHAGRCTGDPASDRWNREILRRDLHRSSSNFVKQ
jgi:hypothetical protein